jgi:hypothetical protein
LLSELGNDFPDGRVPEKYEKLILCKFFRGGLTYNDLENAELFEDAKTFMAAYQDAEQYWARKNQPKPGSSIGRR